MKLIRYGAKYIHSLIVCRKRRDQKSLRKMESPLAKIQVDSEWQLCTGILNSLTAHIALLDESGTITLVNNAWKEFADEYGSHKRNYAVGETYLSSVENATGENNITGSAIAAAIAKILSGELTKFSIEYPCHFPTEKKWLKATLTALRQSGQIRVLVSHADITERKKAESELFQEKERLKAIIENIDAGIIVADKTGKVIIKNRRAIKMDGADLTPSDLHAKIKKHGLFKPDKKTLFRIDELPLVKAVQGEATSNVEMFVKNESMLDGIHISINGSAIIDENGVLSGGVIVMNDVTKLELKNNQLEQFAYIASHDLQEPLGSISGFASLLKEQLAEKLDEDAKKWLNFITELADRMKILIKDLLEYSRIGRKEGLVEVNCAAIMHEILADLDQAIRESGAEITYKQLPVIRAYRTELKLLIQNLVMNAIKFRKKEERAEIEITAHQEAGYWKFLVSDNGIGIGKEYHEKIFNIFQRLHTRNEYDGSGIGLSHCKKIMELHGGRIWVESVAGQGSNFYFTIPENNSL
jgi:signal transduction histidine kinase